MIETLFLRLADSHCLFQGISGNTTWNTWLWKVDPWRLADGQKGEPVFTISMDITEEGPAALPEGLSLCHQEAAGFYSRRVYRTAQGDYLWAFVRNQSETVSLCYQVSRNWKTISLITDRTQTAGSLAFEYLGQLMPSVLLPQGYVTFHGVLMEYQGKGLILSAPSGTGKTTHARLWRDTKNAFILNGDRAVCRMEGDQGVGYGLPWSGTSGEQMNRKVPLTGFVVLKRGKVNQVRRLTGMEAFSQMMPFVLAPWWDRALSEAAVDAAAELLGAVPVYELSCLPNTEAVEVLQAELGI